MTRSRSIAWGLFVAVLGAGVIFTTGACHDHHHHHGHHDDHHHKGLFSVANEADGATVVEGEEPVLVAPGGTAEVELAEGRQDVDVIYDDGSRQSFFDVSLHGNGATDLLGF